jgi:hypothetical protein
MLELKIFCCTHQSVLGVEKADAPVSMDRKSRGFFMLCFSAVTAHKRFFLALSGRHPVLALPRNRVARVGSCGVLPNPVKHKSGEYLVYVNRNIQRVAVEQTGSTPTRVLQRKVA